MVVCAGAAGTASAQLRVAQWNVTNYSASSGRDAYFQDAIYLTSPNGLRMAPDILVIEEVLQGGSGNTPQRQATGQTNVNAFLALLNTAAGSPGDWAAAPYVANGGDTGNALFYRTSRVVLMGTTTLSTDTGTGSDQAPRDTQRWQVRLVGYTGLGAQLYIYGAHYKAGSSGSDQARRDPESRRVRLDANALPDSANFLIGADFNVQNSNQRAYQYLVGFEASPPMSEAFLADASGRFFDPINSPGTWENGPAFRLIHTQDPASAMDSRHDQILISATLRDLNGMDYLPVGPGGNIYAPYYTPSVGNTWNDPNHSYRAWGNDGTTFNAPIRVTGNTMVGPVIAQALVDSCNGLGHLPVFLDVQVPAKVSAPASVDFGTVAQNAPAQVVVQIGNVANVALWSRDGSGWGIDTLDYTLSASAGFTVAPGPFTDAPGGGMNAHVVTMNTSTPGAKSGTLTISSDDPDAPMLVIPLSGVVGSAADYDVNNDGLVNTEDLHRWYGLFTDVDGNGVVNIDDPKALRAELRSDESADTTAGRR